MNFSRRHFLGAASAWSIANAAAAQGALQPGKIAEIRTGDTCRLEDGRKLRLAGIEAPRGAIGDQVRQPEFANAKQFLSQLLLDQEVRFTDLAPDRFGRLRAHAFVTKTDKWVQGELLKSGFSRVRIWADDYQHCAQMLAMEEAARNAALGLWRHPFYGVRASASVGSAKGSFQIVEGQIVDVASNKKLVFLNFGADWRRDFTVLIDRAAQKKFAKANIVLPGLSGANVRVRGQIGSFNGPTIWLSHPQQMEILPST